MPITYTRAEANWANDEAGGTEIDATALNTIEAGIAALYTLVNAAGELIYATAADTLERLAAGTSTQLLHGGTTPSWSQIVSADITDGTIVNGDINASAAIAYSKLNLALGIVNADVSASAAIALSKLAAAAWTPYTPAWTSSGTQPALVDGTAVGEYQQVGKMVTVTFRVTLGASSTVGTGNYRFSLPVASVDKGGRQPFGRVVLFDSSAGKFYGGFAIREGSTTISFSVQLDATGLVTASATAPVVPAQSDVYSAVLVYEAS